MCRQLAAQKPIQETDPRNREQHTLVDDAHACCVLRQKKTHNQTAPVFTENYSHDYVRRQEI